MALEGQLVSAGSRRNKNKPTKENKVKKVATLPTLATLPCWREGGLRIHEYPERSRDMASNRTWGSVKRPRGAGREPHHETWMSESASTGAQADTHRILARLHNAL